MSDGPHKSLNMKAGWKKLAERADQTAFEAEQVAEKVVPALEDDWQEDGCDDLVRRIRNLLGDVRQTSFLANNKAAELEAVRRELSAGRGLRRLIMDHIIQALAKGHEGADALHKGISNALCERAARGALQVEEHYIRKSNEARAASVRARINDAVSRAPIDAFARYAAGLQTSAPPRQSQKQQELDDGVRLP
jgi:hypothetical protein